MKNILDDTNSQRQNCKVGERIFVKHQKGRENTCGYSRVSDWKKINIKSSWRQKWPPSPISLPGEFHGQRILAGCSPRGHKEWETTKWLSHLHSDNAKAYPKGTKSDTTEWLNWGTEARFSSIIPCPNCSTPNLLVSHAASWRRQWHPTPVLLPGKSHGRRSLVGCSPWGHEESDTTECLHFDFSLSCTGEGNGTPTPVFLPGESQGRWSLMGCHLWGCTESDTTEAT